MGPVVRVFEPQRTRRKDARDKDLRGRKETVSYCYSEMALEGNINRTA